eukprot:CAMPEP_0168216780 /NCGR_PEP_ID=MMETSP0140_2-20121125/6838_1 /TAXON_ID=44445 /ORGANISM="Pseudo-nitzschia australis, Strain 10249 10 AB" /LENGTH=66 /DNA_ID=CAMNT_0008144375 /DNA_START=1 /DNA_END=201 /DNA_ORIENTATION=+
MGRNVSIAPRIQSPTRQHIGSKELRQKPPTWTLGAQTKALAFKETVIKQSCLAFGIYWICMVFAET